MTPAALVSALQESLAPLANAARAAPMRAYMKDRYAYLGIPTPQRRAAILPLIKSCKEMDAASLLRAARQLWKLEQREYQYAAIDLLARHQKKLSAADLDALLALVQDKSWWDTVDALADVIGDVMRRELTPDRAVQKRMDEALQHPDFWVRRVALLHQLGWRADTDVARLFRYAETLAHEKEFFIRKAIGWSLRDYAWHDPDCIRTYLQRMQGKLSPLSYREAGKNL